MIKESGSPYEKLKNLKIGKLFCENKAFRIVVIVLVWALAFAAQHLAMFHFDAGSNRSPLMLITGFISIPICEWAVFYSNKKEKTDSKTVLLIKSLVIIALYLVMMYICHLIGCPNYVPPAPDPLLL